MSWVRFLFPLALVGCANGVQVERTVSPDDAARVLHPRIVAIEHGTARRDVREAIGVFGEGDSAYVLTTSGHVPLALGDRLLIRGYFMAGEEVPGGGVVARKRNDVMLGAGIFVAAVGLGIVIGGVVFLSTMPTEVCSDALLSYCGFGSAFAGLAATGIISGGGLLATGGFVLILKSFGQPALIDARW